MWKGFNQVTNVGCYKLFDAGDNKVKDHCHVIRI